MPLRSILLLLLVVSILGMTPAARADWLRGAGRYLGVGWSDGYHARNACPPRHNPACPNCQPQVPWWAVPAPQSEPLPHPASLPPAGALPRTPGGPSLFRQSGEGTTVTITDGPPVGQQSP